MSVIESGGKVPTLQRMICKVRHFVGGAVIGPKLFVDNSSRQNPHLPMLPSSLVLGTHNKLLAKGDAYSRLWSIQSDPIPEAAMA